MFAAALVPIVAGIALAGNFGSNISHPCDPHVESECIANNGTHWWYPDDLQAGQLSATRWVSDNVYDPVADVDTVEMSRTTNVDVIVRDGQYNEPNAIAWTACASGASYGGSDPNRWCRPQIIRYDLANADKFDTQAERRAIACQEMGHTLGLRHSGTTASCMYAPVPSSTGLASHDINELNDHYTVFSGNGPTLP